MAQYIFDTIDEIKAFVALLKKPRGAGKDDDGGDAMPGTGGAPPPLMPPPGGQMGAPSGFVHQPGFVPAPGATSGFPGMPQGQMVQTPGVDPAALALAQRIGARTDTAIASGQAADGALTWLRNFCGPESAQATLDQVKAVFLPRLPVPKLEEIAKMMGA